MVKQKIDIPGKKEHTQVGETVVFGQAIKIFQQGITVEVRADACQFQKPAIGNRIEIIGINGLGISEFVKTDPPFFKVSSPFWSD